MFQQGSTAAHAIAARDASHRPDRMKQSHRIPSASAQDARHKFTRSG
jgi:hypothetical protein